MSLFETLAIVLLVAIVLAITIAAVAIIKQVKHSREVTVNVAVDTSAIEHHAQVSAVMALTQSFVDNPELSANLAGYSQQVVDAALLHRVNSLGHDLQTIDRRVSYYSELAADNPHNPHWSVQLQEVRNLRESVQLQLNAANQVISGRRLQAV